MTGGEAAEDAPLFLPLLLFVAAALAADDDNACRETPRQIARVKVAARLDKIQN